MTKQPPEPIGYSPSLYIGLGPGFIAQQNCQAVIETRRGHNMGRVYWQGAPELHTGYPEGDPRRVLRSPANGIMTAYAAIGQILEKDDVIAEVDGQSVISPFYGILRGLLHPPAMFRDLNIPPNHFDGVTLFRGRGCERCNNSGYSGRTAIVEAMTVTDEIRKENGATGSSSMPSATGTGPPPSRPTRCGHGPGRG